MMNVHEDDEQAPLLDPQTSKSDHFAQEHSTSTVSTVLSEHTPKAPWLSIILGQIASVLICLSGVTSVLLTERNFQIPSSQNMASYLLISLWYTTRVALRPGTNNFFEIMKVRGWKYFLITLADVLGNYFVVKAYQLTSLTSVQLLDCFSIPTVLILSYVFLRARYGHFQYLGVFLSLLSVGCVVWADIQSGRTSEGTNLVSGDILCLAGAALYGLSNVAQEFFVKSFDPEEFLGFIGFFGSFIAGIQTLILETHLPTAWTWDATVLLASFAVIQFTFYSLVARLMVLSSSVALNLSILSADFYSILVGVFLFKYGFSVLYLLSFLLVIGAVGLFSLKTATITLQEPENIEEANQGNHHESGSTINS